MMGNARIKPFLISIPLFLFSLKFIIDLHTIFQVYTHQIESNRIHFIVKTLLIICFCPFYTVEVEFVE